jgi:hypothetical protein
MKRKVQQFVKDIEKELLVQVISNLDQKTITDDKAQKLAKDFIALLPVKSKKILVIKMRNLAHSYKEVAKVYFDIAESIYKEERSRKSKIASRYIAQGDLDRAIRIVKGGIYHG